MIMAAPKPIFAIFATVYGFICLILGCVVLFLPIWGHFEDRQGGYQAERGYFGPWKVCKKLSYGREICGDRFRFQVSGGVYISGVLSTISCTGLAVFCILQVIQLSMITSRDEVVLNYRTCVILKLITSILTAMMALCAAALFATEIDDINRNYVVTRGISFYLQILLVILIIILVAATIYDVIYALRVSGDPTMNINVSVASATTINNPGFCDDRRAGVSVTDSSGKPYATGTNGSIASLQTTVTSISNSTSLENSLIRSPLRSSLKKPRNHDGLGIQNLGFSAANYSPRMNRTGSVKKVRIQTHSTEV